MIRQTFVQNSIVRKAAVLLALSAALLLGFFVIREYTLDLVGFVVCRAFLQKAPPEVDAHDSQEAFTLAIAAAKRTTETRRLLLQKLFEISQRLEKIQRLSGREAREVLNLLQM